MPRVQAETMPERVLPAQGLYEVPEEIEMLNKTVPKRIRDYPPCDRCEERVPGCHGSCERYGEWRRQLDQENEQMKDRAEAEYKAFNLSVETKRKILRALKQK